MKKLWNVESNHGISSGYFTCIHREGTMSHVKENVTTTIHLSYARRDSVTAENNTPRGAF